jgi:hypothetical protein
MKREEKMQTGIAWEIEPRTRTKKGCGIFLMPSMRFEGFGAYISRKESFCRIRREEKKGRKTER